MARWKCPKSDCVIWAAAPSVRPVHKNIPNSNFQSKDPHCPVHHLDLLWVPDEVEVSVPIATGGTVTAVTGKTVDLNQGILLAHFNGTIAIYCDLHQRKHIFKGRWPGEVHTDKPLFKDGLFDQANLAIGVLLATSVPWGKLQSLGSGADVVFDCGKSVVGTLGESDILVQGGFSTPTRITFHAYPVTEDQKRKPAYETARKNGLYLTLDVKSIVKKS